MYINYMEEDENIFFKQIPIRCTLHLVSHGIYSIARGDEYGNEDWVILSLGINYSRWHWIRMSWAQKSINTSKKINKFFIYKFSSFGLMMETNRTGRECMHSFCSRILWSSWFSFGWFWFASCWWRSSKVNLNLCFSLTF